MFKSGVILFSVTFLDIYNNFAILLTVYAFSPDNLIKFRFHFAFKFNIYISM